MQIVKKLMLTLILFFYLAILTKLILFKYIPISELLNLNFTHNQYLWRSNNFVPFKTIYFYLYLADLNFSIRIENLVGNVIGFTPFGFIIPLLSKRFLKITSTMFATFSLSFTYEILQLVFGWGSFDVDDLILNTLGGLIGYISIRIFLFISTFNKKRTKPVRS